VFLSSSKRKKKNILKNSKFKNYRKLEKNKKYYKNLSFSKYEVKIMLFCRGLKMQPYSETLEL
jgi:hypothetical protein